MASFFQSMDAFNLFNLFSPEGHLGSCQLFFHYEKCLSPHFYILSAYTFIFFNPQSIIYVSKDLYDLNAACTYFLIHTVCRLKCPFLTNLLIWASVRFNVFWWFDVLLLLVRNRIETYSIMFLSLEEDILGFRGRS